MVLFPVVLHRGIKEPFLIFWLQSIKKTFDSQLFLQCNGPEGKKLQKLRKAWKCFLVFGFFFYFFS